MARKFTVEEFREMATEAEVIEVYDQFDGHNMDTIAAMLRQSADAMDREKKYEYAVKICFGSEEDYALDLHDDLERAKEMAELPSGNRKIFRREVGEWEEIS